MQKAPDTFTNRFEDLDDMFDYLLDNMRDFMREYVVFCKLQYRDHEDPLFDSRELLLLLLINEFEDQWEKGRIEIYKVTKGYGVNISFEKKD